MEFGYVCKCHNDTKEKRKIVSDWILLLLSNQETVISPECPSVLTRSLCIN